MGQNLFRIVEKRVDFEAVSCANISTCQFRYSVICCGQWISNLPTLTRSFFFFVGWEV